MDMPMSPTVSRAALECWSDRGLVKRVLAGVTGAYEIIRRRYNYGLYRVALSVFEASPSDRVVAALFGRLADQERAPV